MPRKRLTQRFPCLLPLRRWQKKTCRLLAMRLSGNRYATTIAPGRLPQAVFASASALINPRSGQDIRYQYNKTHNLRLAANTLNGLLILPGETFSFFYLVRHADKRTPYKEGLVFADGRITAAYGGGLCQLSNLLFWMFLHTPLAVVERHGHAVQDFPPAETGLPAGVDATVSEGWRDLQVKNATANTFQLVVEVKEGELRGEILCNNPLSKTYRVFNSSVTYQEEGGSVVQTAVVCREETDVESGQTKATELYANRCIIGYPLPASTQVKRAPGREQNGRPCEQRKEST